MVAKLVATCLIVLGISPFTAPFSTCKVGDLFGSRQARPSAAAGVDIIDTEAVSLAAMSEATPTEIGGLTLNYDRRFVVLTMTMAPVFIAIDHRTAASRLDHTPTRLFARPVTVLRL